MNREYSQEDSKLKHGETEEKELAENLQFMRSIVEKTNRAFAPGSPVIIVFGLIFMIGYPATQFLSTPRLHEFIQPMWIILWVIGAFVGIFNGIIAEKREKHSGVISRISNQIGLVWFILLLNGTIWSGMALEGEGGYLNELVCFGELPFLWAAIFAFGLSVTGILSSKEWLFGGIAIFIAILAASIMKEHAYVILGIVMGLACITPAIIAQRNYRKQEKENEQAREA